MESTDPTEDSAKSADDRDLFIELLGYVCSHPCTCVVESPCLSCRVRDRKAELYAEWERKADALRRLGVVL